jgi:hypothetical protein
VGHGVTTYLTTLTDFPSLLTLFSVAEHRLQQPDVSGEHDGPAGPERAQDPPGGAEARQGLPRPVFHLDKEVSAAIMIQFHQYFRCVHKDKGFTRAFYDLRGIRNVDASFG